MILTDKALADFRFWLYKEKGIRYADFTKMIELFQNSLIVEFFDVSLIWNTTFENTYTHNKDKFFLEIIHETIVKANEIYNEKGNN